MKYFTKEWYGLMTFRGYTDGVTPVPDSAVSDEDIARYYREDLEAELSAAKNRGSGADALLAMLGVSNSPVNADPREVRREFEESYKNMLRYGTEHYPDWVKASADRRLLALWRMPKSVYDKLVLEEGKRSCYPSQRQRVKLRLSLRRALPQRKRLRVPYASVDPKGSQIRHRRL